VSVKSAHDIAARNRAAFVAMLKALGTKDFDTFETHLDADIVCEWPYSPMPGFPTEMSGARHIRQCFERDMGAFTPYNYKIQKIYGTDDPEVVIAEYVSDSHYLPRDVPYGNQYVGIMTFHDGKIVRWREYVNPVPILDVIGAEQTWSQDSGRQDAVRKVGDA
jgi:ketosteroid isomerase-like protein